MIVLTRLSFSFQLPKLKNSSFDLPVSTSSLLVYSIHGLLHTFLFQTFFPQLSFVKLLNLVDVTLLSFTPKVTKNTQPTLQQPLPSFKHVICTSCTFLYKSFFGRTIVLTTPFFCFLLPKLKNSSFISLYQHHLPLCVIYSILCLLHTFIL